MDRLGAASGASADTSFLTFMIQHHQGAVEMAGTERDQGANPEAKALAQSIITSQTAEIAEMKKLLAALPPAPR
jgi:uncharacterized protein (DUF305 family)